jgi:hypothetical protein
MDRIFAGGRAQKSRISTGKYLSAMPAPRPIVRQVHSAAQLAAIQGSVVITIQAIEHCGGGLGLVQVDRANRNRGRAAVRLLEAR